MLTFQKESLRAVRPEMETLIRRHYEEVVSNPEVTVLDPDWERFEFMEDAGVVHTLTARVEGALVGYVVHLVVPSLHYRGLIQAHDDAHYLSPEYRKGWAAIKMLRAAEEMLMEVGVDAICYHTKERADIHRGPVFARLGYKPQERIYTKFIKRKD